MKQGEVVISLIVTILGKEFPIEAPTVGRGKRDAAHWYQEKFGDRYSIGFLTSPGVCFYERTSRKKPGRKPKYLKEVVISGSS